MKEQIIAYNAEEDSSEESIETLPEDEKRGFFSSLMPRVNELDGYIILLCTVFLFALSGEFRDGLAEMLSSPDGDGLILVVCSIFGPLVATYYAFNTRRTILSTPRAVSMLVLILLATIVGALSLAASFYVLGFWEGIHGQSSSSSVTGTIGVITKGLAFLGMVRALVLLMVIKYSDNLYLCYDNKNANHTQLVAVTALVPILRILYSMTRTNMLLVFFNTYITTATISSYLYYIKIPLWAKTRV